jgi:hypothetical protein
MLDVRRYQFGLLGHIDLRGTKTTAADLRVVRQLGVSQDKFENSELVFVPWNFPAVAKVLAEPDWLAHGWLNLVHSAIAAFGSGREQLYELLGERTSHAARQGDAGVGQGTDRAQRA